MSIQENIPLIIGVVGHKFLDKEAEERLSTYVENLFLFLKDGAKSETQSDGDKNAGDWLMRHLEDPKTAQDQNVNAKRAFKVLSHWKGLSKTPILVLSSFAPGVDRMVSKIAMKQNFAEKKFRVRAVLPFPSDIYGNVPSSRGADGQSEIARRKQMFDKLSEDFHASDQILVELESDPDESGKSIVETSYFETDSKDETKRRARYQAVGEYIAAHCHILLVIGEDGCKSESDASTAKIVRARLNGLKPDLLPSTRLLGMPAGLTVRIWASAGTIRDAEGDNRCIRLRFPNDENAPDEDWYQKQLWLSLRIGRNLNLFNQTAGVSDGEIRGELCKFLTYKNEKEVAQCFAGTLSAQSSPFHELFRRAIGMYARASNVSKSHSKKRDRIHCCLFLLALAAAFLLHLFAHWHVGSKDKTKAVQAKNSGVVTPLNGEEDFSNKEKEKNAHDSSERVRWILLLVALGIGWFGLITFWWFRPLRHGDRAHDYRALAEGLRVQVFWMLAGLGKSVPANYMQRQRSELDWVRSAIRAIVFPYSESKKLFEELEHEYQLKALRCVHLSWISGQLSYFRGSSSRHRGNLHQFHLFGAVLANVGLFVFLILLIGLASVEQFKYNGFDFVIDASWIGIVASVPFLLVYAGFAVLRKHSKIKDFFEPNGKKKIKIILELLMPHPVEHEHPNSVGASRNWRMFWQMFKNFLKLIPLSVFVASISLAMVAWLSQISNLPTLLDSLIVLGGISLVAGALAFAWGEKNLYSELSYQYNTMAQLFEIADRRMQELLNKMQRSLEDADELQFTEYRKQAQDLIEELGKEALDENAEWLILHRARPLEPIMPG